MLIKEKSDIKKLIREFVDGSEKINWRRINRALLLLDVILLIIVGTVLGACIGYEIDWGPGGLITGGIVGLLAGGVIGFIFLGSAMLLVEMAENIAKIVELADSNNIKEDK